MKVLICGAGGQLGRALSARIPSGVTSTEQSRDELDISRQGRVCSVVKSLRPDIIVNAAAYTAVDAAEDDEASAHAANALGPKYLAEAARDASARLIHVSTDFVFDGMQPTAYTTDSEPRPLNAYGRTKLAGERYVTDVLGPSGYVVRAGWLYSEHAGNFMTTMLRLMRSGRSLTIVSDQIGTPTSVDYLADAIWACARTEHDGGILHVACAGVASWYDFAVAIQHEGLRRGLLDVPVAIAPITSAQYPMAATRPSFSVLDTATTREALGLPVMHWTEALAGVMERYEHA